MSSIPMDTAVPAYREAGNGDTAVILLHGVGGGSSVWSPQMKALAEAGYRAIAWDMPGYGGSAPVAPYTMAALADAVLALIRHVNAARTVLVGHSMGGMVVQETLARAPGCTQALVLVGTSAAFGKPGGEWQQRFLDDRLAPLRAGKSMAELAEQLVPAMTTAAADPAGIAQAKAAMGAVPAATYEAALRALAGHGLQGDLVQPDGHAGVVAAGRHRVAVVAAQLVLHHLAIGQAPVAQQLVQRDAQGKQVAARIGQLAGRVAVLLVAGPLLGVHVAGGACVQAARGLGLAA